MQNFLDELMEVTGLVDSTAACTLLCFFDVTYTPVAGLQHYNTSLLLTSHLPLTNPNARSIYPPPPFFTYSVGYKVMRVW
jgi:hypothetical protein